MVYQDSKMIHTPTVLAHDKFRIYQPSYVSKWMTGPSCIFMHPGCSRMFSGQNIGISPIRTHPLFGNLRFLFSRLGRPKFGVENMSCLNLGESKPAKCPSHEILVGFFQVKTWWLSLDDHDPNWKIFKKQEKKQPNTVPFYRCSHYKWPQERGPTCRWSHTSRGVVEFGRDAMMLPNGVYILLTKSFSDLEMKPILWKLFMILTLTWPYKVRKSITNQFPPRYSNCAAIAKHPWFQIGTWKPRDWYRLTTCIIFGQFSWVFLSGECILENLQTALWPFISTYRILLSKKVCSYQFNHSILHILR